MNTMMKAKMTRNEGEKERHEACDKCNHIFPDGSSALHLSKDNVMTCVLCGTTSIDIDPDTIIAHIEAMTSMIRP